MFNAKRTGMFSPELGFAAAIADEVNEVVASAEAVTRKISAINHVGPGERPHADGCELGSNASRLGET